MAKKRRMRLTPEEDIFWVKTFEYSKGRGYSDLRADRRAFIDTVAQFPRLKKARGFFP